MPYQTDQILLQWTSQHFRLLLVDMPGMVSVFGPTDVVIPTELDWDAAAAAFLVDVLKVAQRSIVDPEPPFRWAEDIFFCRDIVQYEQ